MECPLLHTERNRHRDRKSPFILRTQLLDPQFYQNYDHFLFYIIKTKSAGVLLKMIIVLIELRIAQQCEWIL